MRPGDRQPVERRSAAASGGSVNECDGAGLLPFALRIACKS